MEVNMWTWKAVSVRQWIKHLGGVRRASRWDRFCWSFASQLDNGCRGNCSAGSRTPETVIKRRRQRLTLSRVTLSSTIKSRESHVSSLRPKYHGQSLQVPPLPPVYHFNTLSSACGEFKKKQKHLSRKVLVKMGSSFLFLFLCPPSCWYSESITWGQKQGQTSASRADRWDSAWPC